MYLLFFNAFQVTFYSILYHYIRLYYACVIKYNLYVKNINIKHVSFKGNILSFYFIFIGTDKNIRYETLSSNTAIIISFFFVSILFVDNIVNAEEHSSMLCDQCYPVVAACLEGHPACERIICRNKACRSCFKVILIIC